MLIHLPDGNARLRNCESVPPAPHLVAEGIGVDERSNIGRLEEFGFGKGDGILEDPRPGIPGRDAGSGAYGQLYRRASGGPVFGCHVADGSDPI